jgi:transcriptional regulator with XRE-family HTH domain
MDRRKLSDFVRELRQKQRLSIRGAAKEASVSSTYLWQIEKGNRFPGPAILKKLAPVYKVTTAELLEVAGYLEESTVEEADINRAYRYVIDDRKFQFGARLREEADLETKRVIVQLYEEATGRKLL